MTQYPLMLYRAGGDEIVAGHKLQTLIVPDADCHKEAGKSGFVDFYEATKKKKAAKKDILDSTIPEITAALPDMTDDELIALESREVAGKTRSGVMDAIASEMETR